MPSRTVDIVVSPGILKWARETAGYSPEDVAKRFKLSRDQVASWEAEPARISLSRIEDLARYYKRPTAAFLLTDAPEPPPAPKDFRRPAHQQVPFSPELRLAIRRAYRLQRIFRETLVGMDRSPVSVVAQANMDEDAEGVAREQRSLTQISFDEQRSWEHPTEAFRRWREAVESKTIPVFQGEFRRTEAQGFSLTNVSPFTIVVSGKDAPTARSFTLFHEFAHLLLRDGGICQTEEAVPPNGAMGAKVEEWCDRFAEAFLVDADDLGRRTDTELFAHSISDYEGALRRLAKTFSVSQQVVLFRFWHLGFIDQSRFWSEFRRVEDEARLAAAGSEKRPKQKGGPPPSEKAVWERGPLFARTVLDAFDREIVSGIEAIDYLGVRLKHFDKVRKAADREV